VVEAEVEAGPDAGRAPRGRDPDVRGRELRNPDVKGLCAGIVESQHAEIEHTNAALERLRS